MASRGRLGAFQWVLYPSGELGVRGFECRRLGSWAVRSGRRCGLRLRVCSVVSVAQHFGRKRVGFSACARTVELIPVASVGYGSEGLARGEEVTVPCSYTLGTTRSRSRLAGNARLAPALSACRGQGQSDVTRRHWGLLVCGARLGHRVEGVAGWLARLGGQACCLRP
jgi:hypothetical protein